ncbi:hypothetical protein AGIG_G18966 [Arapaima gigas]
MLYCACFLVFLCFLGRKFLFPCIVRLVRVGKRSSYDRRSSHTRLNVWETATTEGRAQVRFLSRAKLLIICTGSGQMDGTFDVKPLAASTLCVPETSAQESKWNKCV